MQKISYFHVYFEKDHLSFSVQRKNIMFLGKKYHLLSSDNTRKIIFQCNFFEKTLFSKDLKKNIIFPCIWRKISFMNCLKNKIIFLEKRNIIFPNNTRNIIIQCNFLGKTIFSGRLEKEIMVFVQWTPNGYWEKFWETLLFLKSKANFFDLRLEISSWACALRPRLKLIFHWNI